MDKIRLGGLAALTVAFGLGACSHTTVETPAPAASTGATVTTTTTASADTTTRRDSAAGYQASGSTTTSTTVATPSTSATASVSTTTPSASATVSTSGNASGTTANGAQTLTLSPVNNSGFTGTVVLTDMGDHTGVAVTLNSPANTNAGADHNVAIRSGTCAAPGDKVEGLHDVEGNGQASNTDVSTRLSALADGQHVIVVNENPGDRAVACAAIPSR